MTTSNVDWEGRDRAFKALYIIFIIFITMANVALVAQLIRAVGGFKPLATGPRGVRCIILTLLSITDVFTALCGLALLVENLFAETHVTCQKHLAAYNFVFYVAPFVYGLGLVYLCCESHVFRHRCLLAGNKPGCSTLPWVVNLGLGALPLVVGFSLCVPICLADFDSDQCVFISDNFTKLRIMDYVYGVLPTALVVVSAVSINLCDFSMSRQVRTPLFGDHYKPQTGNSQRDRRRPDGLPPVTRYVHHPESIYPSMDFGPRDSRSHPTSQPFACINPCFDGHISRQDGSFPPGGLVLPTAPRDCQKSHQSLDLDYREPAGDVAGTLNVPVEKCSHLFVALVFTVCVLPKILYELWHILGTDGYDPMTQSYDHVVMSGFVFWLACLRGFIMPCSWLITGSLTRRG